MSNINLICREGDGIKAVDASLHQFESSAWKITKETAQSLIGGKIFIHSAQDKPSYFGGDITGWKETPHDPGRITILFTAKFDSKNCYARNQSDKNWGMELRIFD